MKSLKMIPLVLFAAALASGAAHAKGGMGGGMHMGNGGMTQANPTPRQETRSQTREEKRLQKGDGQADNAQRSQSLEQIRNETREQVRSDGANAPGQ